MKIEAARIIHVTSATKWNDDRKTSVTVIAIEAEVDGDEAARTVHALADLKDKAVVTLSDCHLRTYQSKAKEPAKTPTGGKRRGRPHKASPEAPTQTGGAEKGPVVPMGSTIPCEEPGCQYPGAYSPAGLAEHKRQVHGAKP